ncbi:DUF1129 family protein [Enterococcus diestrammenae]|uniref:Uncharacterized protein n=1 Tax=Enterococcus diestrammenae TaxID=1155073 RepID=A0ABV0EZQ6_9ENTE|nr:DUF1129 family protein [Enterococcus diestrammenae]KAF1298514.1 hypothetical protein BAU18_01280 [Enterococcus diestrammenae]
MKKQTTATLYCTKLNQLETQLTPENQVYFADLRGYMSFGGLFLDEGELNMQLYQMATDLLEAQRDGVTAAAFFGKQPQLLADQLLANTKKASIPALLGLAALVVGILWGINLVTAFSQNGVLRVSVPQYLLDGVIGVVGVSLLFLILQRSFYSPKKSQLSSVWSFIATMVVFLLVIAGQLATGLLLIDDGVIRLPYPWDLLLLGVIVISLLTWLLLKGTALYPFVFLVLGVALLGLIHRLQVAEVLQGTVWSVGQGVILVVALGATFVSYRWRKRKD